MSSTAITNETALREWISSDEPRWLFKHSNACGISTAAFDAYHEHLQVHPEQPSAHLVIQTHRPLSNLTAEILGRVHQSPQLFLIRGGEVLWTATHWSISAAAMASAWDAHAA
ncbi:MAG: bacillithiol system redox-active protein YtxJ [Planctomycetota bacterium]|nr:MAG: bacillithiol system redox-active protein YtxJ [Planctomycetota bacterium]